MSTIGTLYEVYRTKSGSLMIHAARARQPRDRGEDQRKVARSLRAEADGLDRQAGLADDEGNRALACKCRAKAASLRLRADSSPV
jgi:hypothetical protein